MFPLQWQPATEAALIPPAALRRKYIQGSAPQPGIGGQGSNSGVADDVRIAFFGGYTANGDDLAARQQRIGTKVAVLSAVWIAWARVAVSSFVRRGMP
jgi:hypothetical protein